MVNLLPKVILIGNPRTGSGSMYDVLGRAETLKNVSVTRNEPASKVKERFDDWDSAFKFGFVRHPVKRFISAYCTVPIMDIKSAMAYNPVIFRKQSKYFDEPVDFIGRYERINTDWRTALRKARLPYMPLPKTNPRPKGDGFHRIETLTPTEESFVREYYAEDFKRFQYE